MPTYNLQDPIKHQLSLFAAPFDGMPGLSKFMRPQDIYYLVTYPGTVAIIKPWSNPIDLRVFGIQENTWLNVLDKHRRFKYRRLVSQEEIDPSSSTGYTKEWFGSEIDERDANILMSTPHGEFLHLYFITAREKYTLLVWVANELAQSIIEDVVRQYKEYMKTNVSIKPSKSLTLYLSLDTIQQYSASNYKIGIAYYSQRWILPPPLNFMRESINVNRTYHNVSQALVLDVKDGWYYLYIYDMANGTIVRPLYVKDPYGLGQERLRISTIDHSLFYIQLSTNTIGYTGGSLNNDILSYDFAINRVLIQANLELE